MTAAPGRVHYGGMAEVRSTFQLRPGERAPDFSLPDAAGRIHSLADIADGGRALVVVFACNHCPFVIHLAGAMGRLARDTSALGARWVAINANDVSRYPADAPDKMAAFANASGWDFPYLFDETQATAKAYAAACTPDFYLFDADRRLRYAGQFDATRPGRGAPTGGDLRAALERVLATGEGPPFPWPPSSGCSIKWKPGSEPAYF